MEATLFARERGFKDYDPATERQVKKYLSKNIAKGGTVGACALDSSGILAAATSTGGTGLETPGRVSDDASPCGNYCTSDVAISATGIGEDFIDTSILPRLAGLLDYGVQTDEAFEYISKYFRKMGGEGGYAALTHEGDVYVDFNSKGMRFYGVDSSGKIFSPEASPSCSRSHPDRD
jgi:L-asparaginase